MWSRGLCQPLRVADGHGLIGGGIDRLAGPATSPARPRASARPSSRSARTSPPTMTRPGSRPRVNRMSPLRGRAGRAPCGTGRRVRAAMTGSNPLDRKWWASASDWSSADRRTFPRAIPTAGGGSPPCRTEPAYSVSGSAVGEPYRPNDRASPRRPRRRPPHRAVDESSARAAARRRPRRIEFLPDDRCDGASGAAPTAPNR